MRIGKAAAITMFMYLSLSKVIIAIITITINERYFIYGIKSFII